MFKKVLSVIFVLLMLLSVVPFALAEEANYNYTVKTEFYGYDSETDDWVPVTTAAGGDTVKLRVSIATNYVSGSANFLLAYDKSVLSADLPSNGSADYLETNPDRKSFAYQSVQQVRGAHGTGVANKLFGNNCISEEEYNKYSFTTISIITKGCVMYDDTDWLFEIDMNVLGGTKGKTFECTVLPGSVQSLSNPKGYISFPKAPDGSTDSTELTAALNWYEGTPVVDAVKVDVTADNTVPPVYTVETYTMLTDGTYSLTSTGHTGTTDEEVTASVSVAEGYELNEEKSILSGTVAADGSLVLKVYYDRKTYKFTTVVNGISQSVEYLYGEAVAQPATPSVKGYTFTKWDGEIPSAMPANDVAVSAVFKVSATVKILRKPNSRTINFGDILHLTAEETADLPEGAYIKWYVEGSGVSISQTKDGKTCDVTSTGKGTVTVIAKLVDKNGNPLITDSGEIFDSQTVVSKAGFFQKLISFFKNLFSINRTINQAFKVF